MRCEYIHEEFSGSDIFNPFNQGTHTSDGAKQCWVEGDDVTEFLSPNGQAKKHYCLFHAHQAPERWMQTKWDIASLGEKQSARLKELLVQWNRQNSTRKSDNETLLTFNLLGMQCGSVDFTNYTFSHDVDFGESTFNGNAWFNSATFRGIARFKKVTFNGGAGFDDATFIGDAEFGYVTFCGGSWFGNATFRGDAWFDDATFSHTAWYEKATFKDIALFNNVTFNEDAWFNYATFSDSFFFNDTTCLKKAIFHINLFGGDVSFNNSKFHNEITFLLPKLEKGGRFVNCQFGSFTYQTHIGERLLFNHCSTGEKLDFVDQDCSRLAFLNMDLTKADFLGADVSKTRFDACQWKEKGGPTYAAVYKHDDYLKPAEQTTDDEDYKDRVSKLKALYRQLMKNLEENREYKQAGDFHYREMELRQKMLKDGLADPESRFERPMLWLYRAVGDFGENYVRLGLWLIASWLSTACLIWAFNPDKTFWHILGIVITAIIPGWPKPQTVADFTPFCKTVLVVEVVIAVILTTLFAMAVNRRFRR